MRLLERQDFLDLQAFTKRLDITMRRLCSSTEQDSPAFWIKDEWGHPDLPEYLPWMGPRYAFAGHDVPMSIFRGEGMTLFLLMRILAPEIAVECFTGTGYAASWIAAGSPASLIYTVDSYEEGGMGKEGYFRALRLFSHLGLDNLIPIHASMDTLCATLSGRRPDVYFSDGPYMPGGIELSPNAVVIRHDNAEGQAIGRSFSIIGGSHLSVMCPSVAERDALMLAMSRYFPVERCDA